MFPKLFCERSFLIFNVEAESVKMNFTAYDIYKMKLCKKQA